MEGLLSQVMGFPNGMLALKEVLDLHGGAEVYVPTATEAYVLENVKAGANLRE